MSFSMKRVSSTTFFFMLSNHIGLLGTGCRKHWGNYCGFYAEYKSLCVKINWAHIDGLVSVIFIFISYFDVRFHAILNNVIRSWSAVSHRMSKYMLKDKSLLPFGSHNKCIAGHHCSISDAGTIYEFQLMSTRIWVRWSAGPQSFDL